jgi:hypothetical protein
MDTKIYMIKLSHLNEPYNLEISHDIHDLWINQDGQDHIWNWGFQDKLII